MKNWYLGYLPSFLKIILIFLNVNSKENYKMRYLVIVLGLLIVAPVFGQRKKKEDEVMVVPTYVEGVTYSLPRTGLRVIVKATKESFVPGPYASYAEQLLGLTDVKARPETKWILRDIQIETFSEPDPEQVYKAMGDAAYKVNLTQDGRIVGVNMKDENVDPFFVKTNKVIQTSELTNDFSFDNITDTPFYIPGDSTNNFKPVRVSAEQKAAEAAKRVLEARMYCYDIASGMLEDLPPDGEAYKISLDQLKQVEKDYLSLFAGRTAHVNDVFSFNFIPSNSTGKGEVIFRISDENGIVPASDLSGKPVMVECEIEKSLIDKYNQTAKSDNPSAGESGIYYRMPAITIIRIISNLNTVATTRLPIAQFGIVAPIPENAVQGGYQIELHAETGAIKSITK